jgi:hypothetical protein
MSKHYQFYEWTKYRLNNLAESGLAKIEGILYGINSMSYAAIDTKVWPGARKHYRPAGLKILKVKRLQKEFP